MKKLSKNTATIINIVFHILFCVLFVLNSYQQPIKSFIEEVPDGAIETTNRPTQAHLDTFDVTVVLPNMTSRFHRLIPDQKSPKRCMYCKMRGTRFACGQTIKTRYKCDQCNVPLCKPDKRDCFHLYHKELYGHLFV